MNKKYDVVVNMNKNYYCLSDQIQREHSPNHGEDILTTTSILVKAS